MVIITLSEIEDLLEQYNNGTITGAQIAQIDNNQAVRDAAHLGHLDVVNSLLEIPEVLENVTANDNAAFLWAADGGHLDIVNILLEIPAVRENAAASVNFALRTAAKNGHLMLVNSLLEIPAVLANATADDNGALRLAAKKGHLAVVNKLLEIPAVRENAAALHNDALCSAAKNGHLDVVNRLLEIPEVLENVTAYDNAALRWAAERGHYQIAFTLASAVWKKIEDIPSNIRENQQIIDSIKEGARLTAIARAGAAVRAFAADVMFPGDVEAYMFLNDFLRDKKGQEALTMFRKNTAPKHYNDLYYNSLALMVTRMNNPGPKKDVSKSKNNPADLSEGVPGAGGGGGSGGGYKGPGIKQNLQ